MLSFTSIPIAMYFSETKQKLASATGFIYKRNQKLYLITNWHNVVGKNPLTGEYLSKHCGIPDVIVLTLLKSKPPKIEWENYPLNLYDESKNSDWLIHPLHGEKIDVVAIELEFDENFGGVFKPLNNIHFDDYKAEIADDIFILGFPFELSGGGYFPIWKRGSIASEPDIDYDGLPKLLVDTASRKGMSGSPVIYRRTGIHGTEKGEFTEDTSIGTIQGFVGVYSGRIGISELDAQLGIVWKKEVIDQIIDGERKDDYSPW